MRPSVRRSGALGLVLLLQVFVLSGFIHPCCLEGGGEGGHMAHEAPVEGLVAFGDVDLSAHHGHPGSTPAPVAHAHAEHPEDDAVHTGHDDEAHPGSPQDDHSCGGCEEGNCGLCCQTAGVTFLPGPIPTVEGSEPDGTAVRPARMGVAVLPAPPPFLLPFANAPPSTATVVL